MINVPGPDLGPPPFSAGPHPRSRVHASVPTPHKINVFFTRTFFLVTKFLPAIILVIMKPYSEIEIHDAIVAVRDGIPIREASRTWHIPRLIL